MNPPPAPLLPAGTAVRVLTHRHRDQVGTVVTSPVGDAWDDLVVWVDLGQAHPVPVLPHEICPIGHTTDHQAHAHQAADERATDVTAADPVAGGLAALRTSWPTGYPGPDPAGADRP